MAQGPEEPSEELTFKKKDRGWLIVETRYDLQKNHEEYTSAVDIYRTWYNSGIE